MNGNGRLVTLTRGRSLLDCAHRTVLLYGTCAMEAGAGMVDRQDRRQVAVVITTDGRRVHLPVGNDPIDVSVLALLRSLLSLDGLLELITGSRRENGGTRRDER